VSRIDGEGNYIDQFSFDRTAAAPFLGSYRLGDLTYLLPDQGLLGQARVDSRDPDQAKLPEGFVVVSPSGEGALLEPFPSFMYGYGFLGRTSLYAAGGNPPIVALGNNDRYEISVYTTSGVLKSIVRNLRPNDPVLQDDLDQYADMIRTNSPPAEVDERVRAFYDADYPTSFPAFDQLFVDRTSHIWVRHRFPEAYDEDALVPWEVYDADGMYVATAQLPGMIYSLYDVGDDFILGRVIADEFGSEEVRLYRLERRR
jgi:hypothetical protein